MIAPLLEFLRLRLQQREISKKIEELYPTVVTLLNAYEDHKFELEYEDKKYVIALKKQFCVKGDERIVEELAKAGLYKCLGLKSSEFTKLPAEVLTDILERYSPEVTEQVSVEVRQKK